MTEIYQWIGILTIFFSAIYLTKKLFRGLWTSFLGNALGFSYDIKPGQDAYAIVTGATDGIGLEYAKYFAKKGFNLLLISRSLEKLNETKDSIAEKFSKCKEIRVHQADFSKSDIYDGIKKSIEELPKVEVLVNNVGISYRYPEYLTKIPDDSWKLIDDLINVNILSVTRMHQIVLPLMEVNQKGLILNLSSFSATYPTPLLSVYGATKTYVDFLSRALQIEYQRKKIVIQSVLPAFVQTKMSKVKKPSLMIPKPEDYVKAQMKTVGLEYRTYGYIPHKIQGFVLDSISNNLFGPYLNSIIVYSNLKKLRKSVYRKFNLKDN